MLMYMKRQKQAKIIKIKTNSINNKFTQKHIYPIRRRRRPHRRCMAYCSDLILIFSIEYQANHPVKPGDNPAYAEKLNDTEKISRNFQIKTLEKI